MNPKTNYSKGSSNPNPSQQPPTSSDSLAPPKTPMKRHHWQAQSSIYATLSPLPFPPKIESRPNELLFVPFSQMCQVKTPLPKERSKFLADNQQDGVDYAIVNRIIFETSREDAHNNSSSLQSSSDPEEESENQNQEQSQEKSQESSMQEGEREERNHRKQGGWSKGKSRREVGGLGNEGTPSKIMCNCKKTKCLKLYCDCFRLNKTCDGCNCVGCHNLQIYTDQRNNAILALMDRNPDPFGQKIQADKHLKGCNCKKSNCLKKYCQCYQAGLKCGQNCKCEQCKNIIFEKGNPQGDNKLINKHTAKKERKMLEI